MRDGKVVLAIDQGTTGSAALAFDKEGHVLAHADREFTQHFPKPGWVEHDADEIWDVTRHVMREALAKAGATPGDVAAIGITNQRETTMVWDATTGRPLHHAIVWQDRRTAPRCEELKAEGWEPRVRRRTGLVVDAYFSGTKVQWLIENVPAVKRSARKGTARFGTMDSWLVHKLTGGRRHVTDVTNASRTMLFNINRMAWDDALTEEFGIPGEMLPEVVPSASADIAETDPDVFGARVPIAGIAGDQQAALFGQCCFRKGAAKNTYGTGSFLLMNTGTERPKSKRLLSTVAWQIDGATEYALEGSVFTTGAAVQWLRDGLGVIKDAAETETLARSVDDTGGVTFVPALQGLGAPWWDMYARGTLIGVSRGTTRAHLARAVLESIALRMVDVARAMQEDSGIRLRTLRVDGGGSLNNFLMQFQADVLGAPVERPRISETTAFGAAALAGIGAGVWGGRKDVEGVWALDARYDPVMKPKEREARYARWLDAVGRARGWVPSA